MNEFKWYRILNKDEFVATQLPSYEATVDLDEVGEKQVVVMKGVGVSLLFNDTLLPVNLNGKNPFRFGRQAVFIDANNDIHLGVYVED